MNPENKKIQQAARETGLPQSEIEEYIQRIKTSYPPSILKITLEHLEKITPEQVKQGKPPYQQISPPTPENIKKHLTKTKTPKTMGERPRRPGL